MHINLADKNLTPNERVEIEMLLARQDPQIADDLGQMWYLMNLVWDDLKCSNEVLNWDSIGLFYSHPVWILNGLFIEQDKLSMGHRYAISDWIVENGNKCVVDYGGGVGTLARLIAEKSRDLEMHIYEPHPSEFGLKRVAEYVNISIIDELKLDYYDCLVSTDVLEHLSDPLKVFSEMIDCVKINGYLVIANNFYPVIKCHLPTAFHFRYTFNIFARIMGLEVVGILKDSHATIYKKVLVKSQNWPRIRFFEKFSSAMFPISEILRSILKIGKRLVRR